jgi:hypothetical protein
MKKQLSEMGGAYAVYPKFKFKVSINEYTLQVLGYDK